MTTTLVSQSPVRALTSRLGELKEEADRRIRDLESTLKHIDETKQLLNEHGIQMVVDLGGPGNAFQHARTAQLADRDTPHFALPKAS
jgi:hypothetical protein